MDAFARCRKSDNEQEETQRRVCTNSSDFNQANNYANNYIKTAKYTIWNFLPLNLFEQFQRIANFYFLVLLILQVIPWISSLTWITTVAPLVFVLLITAAKDAYDDIQRHNSDNLVNNKKSQVLREGKITEQIWQNVVVGDIIKMSNDEFVAADLLLLASSEPNSLAYIETAELDGETNLKVRQALPETAVIKEYSENELSHIQYKLQCEPPNNVLSKFEGTLDIGGTVYSLANDQVLLRGCVLRNTAWCYGMVIFAGKETKLMKNSGKSAFKRTHTDRLLNVLIIGIVVFLFAMSLVCVIACGVWETNVGYYFQDYLPWESFVPATRAGQKDGTLAAGATVISLLVFFSYLILLNTVVPISLYVSVEFLRFVQSLWINWDVKMYYEPKNSPAKARTTALNEELGQIEYIFSDKTGTLTQNIMTFNKCSIQGRSYGDPTDADGNPIDVNSATLPPCNLSDDNPWYDKLVWYDRRLVNDIKGGDKGCADFFRLLALCHTVMPEMKKGKLVYQAQSPDEEALVGGARDLGFVFLSRSPSTITIKVDGEEEIYTLLCILDFNNVRKRMSVIVKKGETIRLLCKGADTTVNARLNEVSKSLLEATNAHLNSYANIGLRTLSLAYKDLTLEDYNKWKDKHYEASIALTGRDDKLHDVYEEIETDMTLIGATAIEDKLQDGVPDTIANLALAGIKIWVLTGDKQETAINIGYSCKLLTNEMEDVFIIDGETLETVEQQLTDARDRMKQVLKQSSPAVEQNGNAIEMQNVVQSTYTAHHSDDAGDIALVSFQDHSESGITHSEEETFGGFGVVINGHSLTHGLTTEMEALLLEVGCMCKAVICCRVTPLQKAQVVELVKNNKKSVTLAIGDGANDVSMIKTAHIGVGISGQEGMQAVLSSDFSFAQFRFLERLLLVHGRWSYLRMCKFLAYFFYKNFSFTLIHFWYAWFIGASAQTIYSEAFIAIYNVVYTSGPVVMMGVFDQDVDEDVSIQYPKLYTPGLTDMWFNKKRFALSLLEGLFTSCVVFFFTYGSLINGVNHAGHDMAGRDAFTFMTSSMLILAVTIRIAIETYYWTPFNQFFVWGSLAVFYIIHAVLYSDSLTSNFLGTMRFLCSTPVYWFGILLGVIFLMVIVLAAQMWQLSYNRTLTDRLRIRARPGRNDKKPRRRTSKSSIKRELRTQSIRSGYAFAHEEGFGELITSGRYVRKNSTVQETAAPAGTTVAT